MNKTVVEIPETVDKLSNWKEFSLPPGHSIIDKEICGCGFTEFCLRNEDNIILCAPRRMLLEDKKSQHPESNVYHFKNDLWDGASERYDLDNKKSKPTEQPKEKEERVSISDLKSDLLRWYGTNPGPYKILVTYDSLHHVLNALGTEALRFKVVVDEFQALFIDAAYKPDVEIMFLSDLYDFPNVTYVSATPMLEKYLDALEYFKDLKFYEFSWPKSKVLPVRIVRRYVKSISYEVGKYINNYRRGIYESKVVGGKLYKSKELVIFCNSIRSICGMIKRYKLSPSETNVLCASTEENEKRLALYGHSRGRVPLLGEPHKMFTFCTKTAYLGADFYSTSAYTIVCSDGDIQTLVVDVSLDLPQILGRQRLEENVFRNEVLYLSKGAKDDTILGIKEEEFITDLRARDKNTEDILRDISRMGEAGKKDYVERLRRDPELYVHDFIGISRDGNPCKNTLLRTALLRSWEISRKEYQDSICIRRGMESLGYEVVDSEREEIISSFQAKFSELGNFTDKMELYCNYIITYPELKSEPILVPREYQNYMELLGPEKIRSLGYREKDISEYIDSLEKRETLKEQIISKYPIGSKVLLSQVKSDLAKIYEVNGITLSAKAVDLGKYLDLKEVLIPKDGKYQKGYKILGLK